MREEGSNWKPLANITAVRDNNKCSDWGEVLATDFLRLRMPARSDSLTATDHELVSDKSQQPFKARKLHTKTQ